MPIRITRTDTEEPKKTILKIEGSLLAEDVEMISEICRDLRAEKESDIELNLADLSFLDSESATELCRLKREQNVTLEGLHLFIKKVIEMSEKAA
ncbi:MAG TPA: hypothetical protein VF556_02070 [Pyrinomonadaceae bacterium]|jgi:ABC-type transporter Mla MlaB component